MHKPHHLKLIQTTQQRLMSAGTHLHRGRSTRFAKASISVSSVLVVPASTFGEMLVNSSTCCR
eukprot:11085260-Prorocentrum_lima.AAC.1